jgi:hypothetical protein
MARYYKITGLDEGIPIDPYVIDSVHESLDCHLCELADTSRHAEAISQRQYTIEKIEGYIEELKAIVNNSSYGCFGYDEEGNFIYHQEKDPLAETAKAQIHAFYDCLRLIKGK